MNYDLEYYENLLRRYSKSAEEICNIRWEWIAEVNPKVVLDYGCGVGWFRAYRPKGVEVFSYDLGEYPQTGVKLQMYDVVCLWDVLEHINDFKVVEPVFALAKYIATTLPVKPADVPFSEFKHFKPGEHLHYWEADTLESLFTQYGFEAVKWDTPECPPRTDVVSVLFRRTR